MGGANHQLDQLDEDLVRSFLSGVANWHMKQFFTIPVDAVEKRIDVNN